MVSCVIDLRSLRRLISMHLEGQDPNLSLILGTKQDESGTIYIAILLPAGGDVPHTLDGLIGAVREEITTLQVCESSHFSHL